MNDFIKSARQKHGNKYDYSKVDYVNSRTKVCVICPEHGEFWVRPSNHLNGSGCRKCANEKRAIKKRLTLDSFLERAMEVHGKKYDYSKVEYVNNSTKVCIICPEHGEFWQTPQNHLKGSGCTLCFRKKNLSTNSDFIKKAQSVHLNKYDYSLVKYENSQTKVKIICHEKDKNGKEHGIFEQTPSTHLQGGGCPKCNRLKLRQQFQKQKEDFIQEAKEIHGSKYDYSKVAYVNNQTKVCIICPTHGEFWQTPNHHLHGSGCPKCYKHSERKLTQEQFLKRTKEKLGEIYDLSKIKYEGYYKPVTLKCPLHGTFIKKSVDILKGHGCPLCGNNKRNCGKKYTKEDFIVKAKCIHGNKYDYSKVEYVNSKTKVRIICPTHGEFWQSPDKHLIGNGCPRCSISISNKENEIKEFINKTLHLDVVSRDKTQINPYEIDLFVPSKNIAIEYDGLIWHSEKFKDNKKYHINKTICCEKKGIRLIHIFEDEWLYNEKIVKSKIKHILGCSNDLPKVFARKCFIKEINYKVARLFLDNNHIQGSCNSSIYLGCFYKEKLVGVMCFREWQKETNKWELTRFASDVNLLCVGIGGKLFNYFVKKYKPFEIKSFADRRWSIDNKQNLYHKMGFKTEGYLPPDYKYTNGHNGRIHKFNFRKQKLLKKYPNEGITSNMTEHEMALKIGFYRIYDCGLIKYVWKRDNTPLS